VAGSKEFFKAKAWAPPDLKSSRKNQAIRASFWGDFSLTFGAEWAIKSRNELDLWRAMRYICTRYTSTPGKLPCTHGSPFRDLIARHKALALALARDFPEADEETLADTIEGASDLPQLLTAVLRSRLEDLSLAEALRRRLGVMRGRLERLEGRA